MHSQKRLSNPSRTLADHRCYGGAFPLSSLLSDLAGLLINSKRRSLGEVVGDGDQQEDWPRTGGEALPDKFQGKLNLTRNCLRGGNESGT